LYVYTTFKKKITVYLKTGISCPPLTLIALKGWCYQPRELTIGTREDFEQRAWFIREGRSLDHPSQLLLNIQGSLEGSSVAAVLRESTATHWLELIRQRGVTAVSIQDMSGSNRSNPDLELL